VVARADADPGRHLRAGVGFRRASAVHPLHLGFDRQAQGRAAFHRRLPARRHPFHGVGVRRQSRFRRLLVHRRRRLDHRPPTSPTARWRSA
jgi:hypothetical protein